MNSLQYRSEALLAFLKQHTASTKEEAETIAKQAILHAMSTEQDLERFAICCWLAKSLYDNRGVIIERLLEGGNK